MSEKNFKDLIVRCETTLDVLHTAADQLGELEQKASRARQSAERHAVKALGSIISIYADAQQMDEAKAVSFEAEAARAHRRVAKLRKEFDDLMLEAKDADGGTTLRAVG